MNAKHGLDKEKAQNTKEYSRGIVVIRKRQAVIPWYHP
jgi:hypothetical protein